MPSYPLMVLILGALACIAPMTIDAYLPAFGAIGRAFDLPAQQVQLTLGLYLLAYAGMTLLHGTLSDCFGRKRVLLVSLVLYALASVCAALAPNFAWLLAGRIGQGLTAGAGMVVGQAIINDCYKGAVAQRTMSYVVMVFGISPAFAPIIGGYVAAHAGWRGVFWLLVCLAVATAALCIWRLPETLAPGARQRFAGRVLLANYRKILRERAFVEMALSFGALFGGFAFLIGAAPDFVTRVLGLPETAFGWLFIPLVVGLLSGSFAAARLASRWSSARLIAAGYAVMAAGCAIDLGYTASTAAPVVPWAVAPIGVFSFGLSLAAPNMTLQALARVSGLSGMAASVLGFVQMIFFSVVSGWFAPLVYGDAFRLAVALAAGVAISGLGWAWASRGGAAQASGLGGDRGHGGHGEAAAARPVQHPDPGARVGAAIAAGNGAVDGASERA
ncbi:multidrug effflux MFS transporter [Chitinasiproducens palmae]|uniref:Bcr/CflA family efflux transporter n=1 Tax=Chitinasiproducens palmae TaxID=1770053 RepID=A0A1H2PVA8_9BURK|nr:multidrug effflux MFS transporter [Chitinasiproducens palmae]SDV51209.1 MFS transporter, DHA1 family, bicyclomycin/chloramphenicol resistance protein [Chitinasiproducens palmae]